MQNFFIYVKFPDMKTFKALDAAKGNTVEVLLRATLIPETKLEDTKKWLRLVKKDQPTAQLQIRAAGSGRVYYSI